MASAAAFPPCPPDFKLIQHYLKIAQEHEKRDPVITYWCRLFALQSGMKLNQKSPACQTFLIHLITWLEDEKKTKMDEESITNEVVAQAHVENYALKLFLWADAEDRAARPNKNVVKAFYTSSILFDVLNTFGELTDEIEHHKKYAKWKAAYIHNCLKNGEIPIPGPMQDDDEFGEGEAGGAATNAVEPSMPIPSQSASSFPPDVAPQAPYPTHNLMPPVHGAHAPPSTPSERQSPPNEASDPVPVPHASSSVPSLPAASSNQVNLQVEDYLKAQKYCKWASSAIQYEDVPTAVLNLQKAVKLLTTGQDS